MGITFDTTSFDIGMKRLESRFASVVEGVVEDVANEVLRLSQREVPHDVGSLQNSGHTEYFAKNDRIVGYNKVYAARLHENPQYHFQKGRKGKYLEDPLKNNSHVFRGYFERAINKL